MMWAVADVSVAGGRKDGLCGGLEWFEYTNNDDY